MKNLLGKSISRELEEKIDHRESVVATKGDRNFIQVSLEGDDLHVEMQSISNLLIREDSFSVK